MTEASIKRNRPAYLSPAEREVDPVPGSPSVGAENPARGFWAVVREFLRLGNWLLNVMTIMFMILLLPVLWLGLAFDHLEVFWIFGLSMIVVVVLAITEARKATKRSS